MVVVVAYGSGGRGEEGREMRAEGFRAGGSTATVVVVIVMVVVFDEGCK